MPDENRHREPSISDQIWTGIDEMKILMQRPSKPKHFRRNCNPSSLFVPSHPPHTSSLTRSPASSLSEQPPILRLPLKVHQNLFSYLSPETEFHLAQTCRTMRFVFLGLYPLGLRAVDEVSGYREEDEEKLGPEESYVGRILGCSMQ